jgi:hypothetical protein
MRMAAQNGQVRLAVLALFEQSFQAARRPPDHESFDFSRHE